MRKTAGSTLSAILRQSFLSRHCDVRVRSNRQRFDPIVEPAELRRMLVLYPNAASIAGHGVVPFMNLEDVVPGVRYYTIVRKPLERCASDYQFRVQRGGLQTPFEEWIQLPYARNHQVRKLAPDGRAETAIEMLRKRLGFVGITERFHESLIMFRRWCGSPELDIRYRSKNVASNNDIKRELMSDRRSRQQLLEANLEDLRLYAAANEVFLEQRAEYGDSLSDEVAEFEATNFPTAKYPRQIPSMLKRELLYKPVSIPLSHRVNPPLDDGYRRAA
ncbi:MAG: hypothetical protein AAF497_00305 [Planctomycetota bacterium]